MKEDSKEVKKGSQYDHVRSVKPSGTAKQKSDYASRVPFADEAKEEERTRDSESSHGEDINGKEYVNHRAGPAPNILQEDSPAVVEHEEPGAPPQTLPGAVAVGGSGHARSSADDEWSLEESQGISQQPLAMHSIEGGQHEAVSAILVDESAPDIPARVTIVDAEAEAKAQRRRSMINIMVSCGLTSLVAIVAAVVAVVLTRNKSGNETVDPFTSNPTSVPPSPSPTSALFSLLSKKSFDDGAALLTDGSPQQQAMIWLESEPGTTENMDTAKLLHLQWLNRSSNDQFVDRSSWLFSINDDCGAWFGLDCNEDETQVISIQLNNNTLKGTLPREIGLLTNLLTLIISYNNFTGTIPTEIGYLTSLTDFEADSNDFNGTLPTEIGYLTGLTIFYVNENQLTGALPSEIGHLTNATVFKIGKNKFTGIIPTEIGLMSALSELFGPKLIFLECLC
jgi:hypothetical protein